MISIKVKANVKLPNPKDVQRILKEAELETVELGRTIVEERYATSQSDNEVYVYTEQRKDGTLLVAEGEGVGVLEFGAGTTTNPNMFANEAKFGVYPGSWSEINTQEFTKYGSWHYKGEKYFGIEPTRGMESAYNGIKSNGKTILEEKLKEMKYERIQ